MNILFHLVYCTNVIFSGLVNKMNGNPWIIVSLLKVLAEACDFGEGIDERVK